MDSQSQTYFDERKLLIEGESQVASRFDNSILTLSGGALLLSMTFIKDVVVGDPVAIWLLITAWILLGATILEMLLSLISSQKAYQKQLKNLDNSAATNNDSEDCNCWSEITRWLNRSSIFTFSIGIFFLGVFVITNMHSNGE